MQAPEPDLNLMLKLSLKSAMKTAGLGELAELAGRHQRRIAASEAEAAYWACRPLFEGTALRSGRPLQS
jgi:hypothetical protein